MSKWISDSSIKLKEKLQSCFPIFWYTLCGCHLAEYNGNLNSRPETCQPLEMKINFFTNNSIYFSDNSGWYKVRLAVDLTGAVCVLGFTIPKSTLSWISIETKPHAQANIRWNVVDLTWVALPIMAYNLKCQVEHFNRSMIRLDILSILVIESNINYLLKSYIWRRNVFIPCLHFILKHNETIIMKISFFWDDEMEFINTDVACYEVSFIGIKTFPE